MIKQRSGSRYIFALFIAAALTVFDGTSHARSINDGLGRTSFTWLKSISDAGISSAGECFAARDSISGLLVHPAAVAGIITPTAKMSFVSQYVDTQYGSIGYAPTADAYGGDAYEDTLTRLAPEWQAMYEKKALELIGKLH